MCKDAPLTGDLMTHKKTANIDGDIIAYSVGFAANKDPVENALHSAKIMIRSMLEATGCDSYQIYLTGKGNYREEMATIAPYKGNRTQDKPVHYQALRDYLIAVHGAIVIEGREADDALGCAQAEDTVLCTIDKDLDMIAGAHYNWRKQINYNVSQPEADIFFMKQLMTGDRTDNIKGLDGIGDVKAQRIIDESDNMTDLYWKILEMYAMQYDKPYEAMMENANLLWIQREEGVLWDSNIAEFANEPSD